ncbi:MAG: glycosyl transferase [Microcoleus sp. CSU_2_2]|nr:glycosyl transferase [Microcoleus sp. SU_5_3]NJS11062.1 glycosyl transferase [Microcoleus sp. CSU_2_2]
MKKLMFYCQHILGIGHLVRSMEIVRGLVTDFEICFVNGGKTIAGFEIPAGVEVVNLPAIETDSEFQNLAVVDDNRSLEEVQEFRKDRLLEIFNSFQPDILMIELFPFGRRRFSFELMPLLEQVKAKGRVTKVVCSLRDIVVTKQDQERHEEKICKLMNQYFDLLLIHGDRQFQPLEESFSRISDLNCKVHYTGYVVQSSPVNPVLNDEDKAVLKSRKPIILASIGGGRFGHELLESLVEAAPIIEWIVEHQIQIFTGPFFPDEKFAQMQASTANQPNINIQRYTPNLLAYMEKADLSISMGGYNTTMNILTTGVRSMMLPFVGNGDLEQTIRSQKLEKLGILNVIRPADLEPRNFAKKIVQCLMETPNPVRLDLQGVDKTAAFLNGLVKVPAVAA